MGTQMARTGADDWVEIDTVWRIEDEKYKTHTKVDASAVRVTSVSRLVEKDTVRGAQYKTAAGELETDYGGARISGRLNGGSLQRITGRLVG